MRPKRLLRYALIAASTVVAFYAASVAGVFLFLDSGCGNEPLAEVVSPDGKLKAVVFQRDCGATTGFSTQVAVLSARSALPNESGNVFTSDTNHGAAPSGPGGGPEIGAYWRSATELAISHHPTARVFTAQRSVGTVQVIYEKSPPKLGS